MSDGMCRRKTCVFLVGLVLCVGGAYHTFEVSALTDGSGFDIIGVDSQLSRDGSTVYVYMDLRYIGKPITGTRGTIIKGAEDLIGAESRSWPDMDNQQVASNFDPFIFRLPTDGVLTLTLIVDAVEIETGKEITHVLLVPRISATVSCGSGVGTLGIEFGPVLEIKDYRLSGSPKKAQAVAFSVKIKNVGDEAARNVYVKFQVDSSVYSDFSTWTGSHWFYDPINVGQTITRTITVTSTGIISGSKHVFNSGSFWIEQVQAKGSNMDSWYYNHTNVSFSIAKNTDPHKVFALVFYDTQFENDYGSSIQTFYSNLESQQFTYQGDGQSYTFQGLFHQDLVPVFVRYQTKYTGQQIDGLKTHTWGEAGDFLGLGANNDKDWNTTVSKLDPWGQPIYLSGTNRHNHGHDLVVGHTGNYTAQGGVAGKPGNFAITGDDSFENSPNIFRLGAMHEIWHTYSAEHRPYPSYPENIMDDYYDHMAWYCVTSTYTIHIHPFEDWYDEALV